MEKFKTVATGFNILKYNKYVSTKKVNYDIYAKLLYKMNCSRSEHEYF